MLRRPQDRRSPIGVTLPYDEQDGVYERYTGDSAVPGKGELLIWRPHALA